MLNEIYQWDCLEIIGGGGGENPRQVYRFITHWSTIWIYKQESKRLMIYV